MDKMKPDQPKPPESTDRAEESELATPPCSDLVRIKRYIGDTPELLSLLYDLDLLPEQVAFGSQDYFRMVDLAEWYRKHFSPNSNVS